MNPGDTGALLRLQTEVLEAVACGTGLAVVADLLCRRAEALAPGVICSILTVDADGTLHPLAGPSLPSSYSTPIDCLQMGPKAGACGTAAFRREPVVVSEGERQLNPRGDRQLAHGAAGLGAQVVNDGLHPGIVAQREDATAK